MARGVREGVSSTGWSSEMADAWSILGGLSQQHRSEHWPPWRLVETHWVPDLELGPLGVWDGSDRRSAIGHFRARLARILIARRPVPPLPHRARTFHQCAERVLASRGPASAWTRGDTRALSDSVVCCHLSVIASHSWEFPGRIEVLTGLLAGASS